MKLAIMQPYFFPYIGYFQLLKSVDTFVIYDDVNFMKKGWVNRNQILVQGAANMFTVPLVKQSQFSKINETMIDPQQFEAWKSKFLKTTELTYKKAPYFYEAYGIVTNVVNKSYSNWDIAEVATESITAVSEYLKIDTEIQPTSASYGNENLKGQERIIDICKVENCTTYINAIGGQELYDKNSFNEVGISLHFIKPTLPVYKQFKNDFVSGLSIIDVLMFNSPEAINTMLDNYNLV